MGGCPSGSSRSATNEPLATRRAVRRGECSFLSMRPLSAPVDFGSHPVYWDAGVRSPLGASVWVRD